MFDLFKWNPIDEINPYTKLPYLKIAIIIISGIFVFFSARHTFLASKSSQTPQASTCDKLIEDGPGDNTNILLSDFIVCVHSFVYEKKTSYATEDGPYRCIYVPIVSRNSKWYKNAVVQYSIYGEKTKLKPPTDIKLIMKMNNVDGPEEIVELAKKPELQGMIINSIVSIKSNSKRLLKDAYPGLALDDCYIFEPGRQPEPLVQEASVFAGSLAVLIIGLLWLIVPIWKYRKAAAIDLQPQISGSINADDFPPPAPEVDPNNSKPTSEMINQPDAIYQDDRDNPYA